MDPASPVPGALDPTRAPRCDGLLVARALVYVALELLAAELAVTAADRQDRAAALLPHAYAALAAAEREGVAPAEVARLRLRVLGPDHPDTLASTAALAETIARLNPSGEARRGT